MQAAVAVEGARYQEGNDPACPKERKKSYEKARPDKWKRNLKQTRRRQGLSYEGNKGNFVERRSIGLPCTSGFCQKSSIRECQKIPDETRLKIFDKFWFDLQSWPERKLYVTNSVKCVEIKQKRKGQESRRQHSYEYYLSHGTSTYRVCKQMFASTLGMSQRTLMSWIESNSVNATPSESSGEITEEAVQVNLEKHRSNKSSNASKEDDITYLLEFLDSLATVPSHYCRAAYADRKFLEPGTTLASIYEEYKAKAQADDITPLSYTTFQTKFKANKFSVFVPRKDQCDVCLRGRHGHITQEELERHRELKQKAQDCKKADKLSAETNGNVSVWTMDVQAVLLCPKTDASCMYFKTKLQVHNFTLMNLKTRDGYCYVWDETSGTLSSDVFAWLQFDHFRAYLEANEEIDTLIVWSDGCGYQNRNATVTNAYLQLAAERKITIEQKFLVPGHTQMECDSMHSLIERRIRGPMFTPRDYVTVMQGARSDHPYQVKQLQYHNFQNGFQNSFITSIRPGKKSGDEVVHDLRALRYTDRGVEYKTSFDTEYTPLPQRLKSANVHLKQMYESRLPIKKRKYNDLMSLTEVIPSEHHHFYENLPYE